MEKDTIFYLYATGHVSISNNFCGILHAESVNFRTFGEVSHLHKELKFFFLYFNSIYAHI